MHTFTIAFISTLSLGVCAATIGDSTSHLVTREQHNRLFHSPDFSSASPLAESSERSEKISPRQPILFGSASLGEILGISGSNIDNARVDNAQADTVNLLSDARAAVVAHSAIGAQVGAQAAAKAQVNTVIPVLPPTVNAAQFPPNARVGNIQAVNAIDAQAALIVLIAPNAQALDVQAALIAQAALDVQVALIAQAALDAQVVNNVEAAVIAFNNPVDVLAALRVGLNLGAAPVDVSNPLSLSFLENLSSSTVASLRSTGVADIRLFSGQTPEVEGQPHSQQDMKRQVPANLPVPVTLPSSLTAPNLTPNNTARATREESIKLADDQVEDMDFSAHEADEAERFEESF